MLAGLTALDAAAADNMTMAMTIELENAPSQTIVLDNIPKITFSENDMIVSVTDSDDLIFPMDNIVSYGFIETEAGADTISSDSDVALRVSDGDISVRNIEPGSHVRVYNLQGITVTEVIAGDDKTAFVDTSSLPSGVYIVNYGIHSTKFVKK